MPESLRTKDVQVTLRVSATLDAAISAYCAAKEVKKSDGIRALIQLGLKQK
jgi:hypothetical protein